jgi:hypothetical protein
VFKLLQLSGRGLVTRRLLPRSDGEMANRRVEERLQIGRQPEAGELPQQIQERLLQHIQRGITVPGEPIGEPGDPVPVAKVQHLEGGCVATVNGGDQLHVAA